MQKVWEIPALCLSRILQNHDLYQKTFWAEAGGIKEMLTLITVKIKFVEQEH